MGGVAGVARQGLADGAPASRRLFGRRPRRPGTRENGASRVVPHSPAHPGGGAGRRHDSRRDASAPGGVRPVLVTVEFNSIRRVHVLLTCRNHNSRKVRTVSHPAVTSAIPGTAKLSHSTDNLGAARGPLPDEKTREKMVASSAGVAPPDPRHERDPAGGNGLVQAESNGRGGLELRDAVSGDMSSTFGVAGSGGGDVHG